MLLLPLLSELASQNEILHVIADAWLDHRAFKPLIETGDRNPFGIAGRGRLPTLSIGLPIIAWHNIGILSAWHFCIVVAWDDAGCPDFASAIGAVVRVNFVAEPLIDRWHSIV